MTPPPHRAASTSSRSGGGAGGGSPGICESPYPGTMATPGSTGARRDWTRPELLRALSLYCQIPFGQIHSNNRHITALAAEIGRTPSSVSLKLSNLASLDPYHKARGVAGMSNASRGDKAIWEEFYGRWDALAEASTESLVREANKAEPTIDEPALVLPRRELSAPATTEAVRSVTVRIGQAFFRNAVLAAWGDRCALTDISEPGLLRASHIRPWSSHPESRLDPSNGLCLNALHDAAFDRGLITFSDRFELKLSKGLRETVPASVYAEMFAKKEGTPLRSPDRFGPSGEAMEFHRQRVFCQ
jgi:putative restriction endonuclease